MSIINEWAPKEGRAAELPLAAGGRGAYGSPP